jgi:hypothetical protein
MQQLSREEDDHLSVVDYEKTHDRDIRMALKRLRNTSIVAPDSGTPLFDLLASRGKVFHLPNTILPRQLRLKRIARNTEVVVGRHSGLLSRELGRGAYGLVVLMDVFVHNVSSKAAIKVQSPTDSLAWEYEVLQRLEDRMSKHGMVGTSNAYPRPLGFISLADGGILSMSAASDSGLNLVDLSNIYKLKLGEPVPELIALHYTSQMLNIVADMHLHCKILVRFKAVQKQNSFNSESLNRSLMHFFVALRRQTRQFCSVRLGVFRKRKLKLRICWAYVGRFWSSC